MSKRKPKIVNADNALVFLDYQATFATGETSKRCAEIAAVIREFLEAFEGEDEAAWLYLGAPLDVVAALTQRSWDEDVSEEDRMLFEAAAKTLDASLSRNVRLAFALEKTEAGL